MNVQNPKSLKAQEILGDYVKVYNHFHKNMNSTLEWIQEERMKSLTHKELEIHINTLMKGVEDALLTFYKAYFRFNDPKKIEDQIVAMDDLDQDWDVTKLKKEQSLELSAPPSWNSVEYLIDSNVLITGDTTGNVTLWEPKTWECISTHSYHSSAINTIKYHPKRDYFFTDSDDKAIKVSKLNKFPITIDTIATFTEHKDKWWNLLIVEEYNTL